MYSKKNSRHVGILISQTSTEQMRAARLRSSFAALAQLLPGWVPLVAFIKRNVGIAPRKKAAIFAKARWLAPEWMCQTDVPGAGEYGPSCGPLT